MDSAPDGCTASYAPTTPKCRQLNLHRQRRRTPREAPSFPSHGSAPVEVATQRHDRRLGHLEANVALKRRRAHAAVGRGAGPAVAAARGPRAPGRAGCLSAGVRGCRLVGPGRGGSCGKCRRGVSRAHALSPRRPATWWRRPEQSLGRTLRLVRHGGAGMRGSARRQWQVAQVNPGAAPQSLWPRCRR